MYANMTKQNSLIVIYLYAIVWNMHEKFAIGH